MNGPTYEICAQAIREEVNLWRNNVKDAADTLRVPTYHYDAPWLTSLAWLNTAAQGIVAFSPRSLGFVPAAPAWVLGEASKTFVRRHSALQELTQQELETAYIRFRNGYKREVDDAARGFNVSQVGLEIRDHLYRLLSRRQSAGYIQKALADIEAQARQRYQRPVTPSLQENVSARRDSTERLVWQRFAQDIIQESKTIPTDPDDLSNWAQTHFRETCDRIYQIFVHSRRIAAQEGATVFVRAEQAPQVLLERSDVAMHCIQRGVRIATRPFQCETSIEAVVVRDDNDVVTLFDSVWQYEVALHEDSRVVGFSPQGHAYFRPVKHVEIIPKADAHLDKFPIADAVRRTHWALERAYLKVVSGA
ncbi:MAG: hypothetical protein LAT63_01640 [Marinobacter sp.]|nr:hypothetical protein [Marinobacter sp.]